MSVLVLVEVQIKPEEVSNWKSYMAEILPDTRVYDGCQEINVYCNTEDMSSMVVVEHWDSRAHHENYVAWRSETGDKFGSMIAGPPSIRYFERIDA